MGKCPGVCESLVLVGLWTEAPNSYVELLGVGVVMSANHRLLAWQSACVSL